MKLNIKDRLRAFIYLVTCAMKADWQLNVLYLFLYIIVYMLPLAPAFLWQVFIDSLIISYAQNMVVRQIWIALGLFIGVEFLIPFIWKILSLIETSLTAKITLELNSRVMQKMVGLGDAFFDDPQNKNSISAVSYRMDYTARDALAYAGILASVISFAVGATLFLSSHMVMGLIFLFTAIPGGLAEFLESKKMDMFSLESIPEEREKDYYKAVLAQSYYAQEMRLFNYKNYMKDKYLALVNIIRQKRFQIFRKSTCVIFCASLFSFAGLMGVIIFSAHAMLTGTMTLGFFVLYVQLANTVGVKFKEVLISSWFWDIVLPHAHCFSQFVSSEDIINDGEETLENVLPTIEFRKVCFRYPNSDVYALKNASFIISPGEKIALVGINGAGKSTIVKLLLRFYDPESGQVLINGKDIKAYTLMSLRALFGVCFQNVNVYSLTLRENIALSDMARMGNSNAVSDALQAASGTDILTYTKNEIDAELTRQFDNDGYEPSGGQAQKINIARAFFRDAKVMILDEPSSALDPEAEDFLMKSFKTLCQHKSGIIISHRLSGVIMVDRIMYIDNGAIIEDGTHSELMNNNGKYAEMYRMQAEKYVTQTEEIGE